MKGKALARITLKVFLLATLSRLLAWQLIGGSIGDVRARLPWFMDATGVLIYMCAVNLVVIVTWNLVSNLREADETIDCIIEDARQDAITSWDRRPGGTHVITTGGQVKYFVPQGPPLAGVMVLPDAARHAYYHEHGIEHEHGPGQEPGPP